MNAEQILEFGAGTSQRLRDAVTEVLTRLSADDRDLLKRRKILVVEQTCRGDDGIDLFGEVTDISGEWSKFNYQVAIDAAVVPIAGALQALVAHELSHVFKNHSKDLARWKLLNLPTERQNWEGLETEANYQVQVWGFGRELEELRQFMAIRKAEQFAVIARKTLR